MRLRRPPPSIYSRIEEIRENRTELVLLVTISIGLGVMLNLLASLVYAYLTENLDPKSAFWLIFSGTILLIILLLGFAVAYFYNRGECRSVQLDIVIPYFLPDQRRLEIIEQHRFRPRYRLAWDARNLFQTIYKENDGTASKLRQDWNKAHRDGEIFQTFIADLNAELVDTLILIFLHHYCDNSLGDEAKYDWWKINLKSVKWQKDQLPERLKNNRFVNKKWAERHGWNADEWRLLLPEDVHFEIAEHADRRTWTFRHRFYGEVSITCNKATWVETKIDSEPAQALCQACRSEIKKNELFILGTRAEARASFRMTFSKRADNFLEWSAGLLANIEQWLDFGYFLSSQPPKIIVDLPWKIGDLPSKNDSIWKKLDQIEAQQKEILGWLEQSDAGDHPAGA